MAKQRYKEFKGRAMLYLEYLEEHELKVDGEHDKEFYRDIYYKHFKVLRSDLDWKGYKFASILYPLKKSGLIGFNDGMVNFSSSLGKRRKRVTVDQHFAMSLSRKAPIALAELDEDFLDKLSDENLPMFINKSDNGYYCKLCKVECTHSLKTLREHCRGKKHRLHYRVYKLNEDKSLRDNKSDIKVSFSKKGNDSDDIDENYMEVNLKHEGEPMVVVLNIHNVSKKHCLTLTGCKFLRNYSVYKLSDQLNATDGQTLRMSPDAMYEVQVTINPCFIGSFLANIVFTFERLDDDKIKIVRKIAAHVKNTTVDDLQPVGIYVKPKPVVGESATKTIEGLALEDEDSSQLEREIPLKNYSIPGELRRIANSGFSEKNLENAKHEELLSYLKTMLKEPVAMDNHQERFQKLLYIEEIQMSVDIRKYDMEKATLTKNRSGRLLVLQVPGLAENRPSVLKGDRVFLRKRLPGDKLEGREYAGPVHVVGLNEVELGVNSKLMSEFVTNMKFHVRFTYNRATIRSQHRAVELCQENSLDRFLFPTLETTSTWGLLRHLEERIVFYNRLVERNTEQALAVRHILAGSSRPSPYLIFGPPGTGKTITLVEAMKQVCKCISGTHILACAPSNSAADLLALRLLEHIDKSRIMRLNAKSRHWSTVPEKVQEISNYDKNRGNYFYPSKQDLSKFDIIVCTLVTSGRLASANFPQGHFTHIFIDECGQAVEPEALIAIAGILEADTPLANGGQIVLAGDPKQLGPILRSPFVLKHGLDMSLLERFMTQCEVYSRYSDPDNEESNNAEDSSPVHDGRKSQKSNTRQLPAGNIPKEIRNNHFYNPKVLTKLVRNYRSHPDILALPNELFYKGELEAHADILIRESFCRWEELPKKGFPLIFHGVTGNDMREANSPSFFNPEEAAIALGYIQKIKEAKVKIPLNEIGVITPYRKQVQKIKTLLKKNHLNEITVGSVEEFQGQERRVIIVSTVRSNPKYLSFDVDFSIGFLKNPKRFNVAITRAKALLIVIGNPYILAHDYHWRRLIEYCTKHGGYTGCDFTTDEDLVDDITGRLNDAGLNEEETLVEEVAEKMSGLDISDVTHQEEPQWRHDL